MSPKSRLTIAAAVVVVAVAACSDPGTDPGTDLGSIPTTGLDSTSPTSVVTGDFVFGSGILPDTVPEDFPIPDGGAIGDTLVNTKTGFTQVSIVVPADTAVTALFFQQNLEARGYDFDPPQQSSEGRWAIAFSKGDVAGTIDIVAASAGISTATVELPGTG